MEWHQDNLIFVELLPMVNRIAMAMIWATIWALLGKQFILVFDFKYSFSTDCAVMTEGGTYLLVSNRNAWKLGVCGWEELPGIAIVFQVVLCSVHQVPVNAKSTAMKLILGHKQLIICQTVIRTENLSMLMDMLGLSVIGMSIDMISQLILGKVIDSKILVFHEEGFSY